ncbi:hypothetical protein [Solibacillus sp. R5-41]|nr:hypothetical protein [Solibacillus sp. R5-41]
MKDKLRIDDFFEFGSLGNVWYKRGSIDGEGLTLRKVTILNLKYILY